MKLERFISANMEAILREWEGFARTQTPAAGSMDGLALRDHARQILQAIALDMATDQNPAEQIAKSQGLAPDEDAADSAASIHGSLRHASNFSLLQLSAEFRALRATVLRLWLPQVKEMTAAAAEEMVRFNEAIDQALAESVITYSARADQMRELFLAILGHDLRAPLSNMTLAAELLTRGQISPDQASEAGVRVKRGARLMSKMVNDLLGYTRTELGAGMPTVRTLADIGAILADAQADAQAVYPGRLFLLNTAGVLSGHYDAVRLHQLFTNLMVNAAQHGVPGEPVRVTASGDEQHVHISVNNHGAAIPAAALDTIFQPLVQLPAEGQGEGEQLPRTSLGLGLFVAREIVHAHGGSIAVSSSEQAGTTFTVTLPAHAIQA